MVWNGFVVCGKDYLEILIRVLSPNLDLWLVCGVGLG
jgi:hypothetical protein